MWDIFFLGVFTFVWDMVDWFFSNADNPRMKIKNWRVDGKAINIYTKENYKIGNNQKRKPDVRRGKK